MDTDLKPDNFNTLTSDIDFNLENEKFAFNAGFTAYENLSKTNMIVINMYYLTLIFEEFFNNNFASFNFISQGDNILKDK